jgi:hypothetical protein
VERRWQLNPSRVDRIAGPRAGASTAPRVSDFVRTGIDVVWTRGECRPPRRARRETNASPCAVSPVSGVRTLSGRRSDPVSDVCSLLR